MTGINRLRSSPSVLADASAPTRPRLCITLRSGCCRLLVSPGTTIRHRDPWRAHKPGPTLVQPRAHNGGAISNGSGRRCRRGRRSHSGRSRAISCSGRILRPPRDPTSGCLRMRRNSLPISPIDTLTHQCYNPSYNVVVEIGSQFYCLVDTIAVYSSQR